MTKDIVFVPADTSTEHDRSNHPVGASEHERRVYGLTLGSIPGGSRAVRGVPMRPVMSPASSAYAIFDASRTLPGRLRQATSNSVATRLRRYSCH